MSRRKAHPAGEPAVNQFIQALDGISRSHGRYENFRQFLEAAYCALAKRTAPDESRAEALEKRYMAVVAHYAPHQKEVMQRIAELFGELQLALARQNEDFLGSVYQCAGFSEEQNGQFFTPAPVCKAMALMTLDRSVIEQRVAEKRPVTLCEPACGSGAMVIAAAEVIKVWGFDYAQVLLATLIDIDPICMKMAFLQMSLLGIPAICIHGNALANTEWERAITAAALQQWWERRAQDDDQSSANVERVEGEGDVPSCPRLEEAVREDRPAPVAPAHPELQIQGDLFAATADDE